MFKFLITLLLLPLLLFGDECLDLENDFLDDFVLETKKIEIPGFPNGFNPSFIEFRGDILLCFRAGKNYEWPDDGDPDYVTLISDLKPTSSRYSPNNIVFVLLDKNFNQKSTPQILEFPNQNLRFRQQDPRLVKVDGDLYLVYSDIFNECTSCETRRMCVAKIAYNRDKFSIKTLERALDFDGLDEKKLEKNWTPFDYKGTLLMAYTISPHRVLGCYASKWCEFFNSCSKFEWPWGELRGGTPAIKVDDHYLAFFHSSTLVSTIQSEGKKIQHYFIGAYTFAGEPPFELQTISPKPIVGKGFYNGEEHQTWKPLRVVWPAGIIVDKESIWISYGRQDHEMWIAKLDKEGLYRSLVPVACD
jgi:predicted GH43/DUF377 family glycosyl hydrolase